MTIYKDLLEEIRSEFPSFKIIKKQDSFLMKVIDRFLKIISFGKQDQFMTSYITTLGTKVYVPLTWDDRNPESRIIILRHERVHMRQAKKYTRVLFSFLYLFVFFPIGFAYFRAKFEKEAYFESLRARAELLGPNSLNENYKEHIVKQFITASYLWAWPFRKSIETWYDNALGKVLLELEEAKEE